MYGDVQSSIIRVVLVGDSSVGKTSILNRLILDKFNNSEQSTVGANYHIYSQEVDGKTIEIQLWDTAGQEKYRSLGPIYFRNSAGALVVFDLTAKETFDNLNSWIDSFTDVAGSDTVICIAANKCDLTENCEVPLTVVGQWCKTKGYHFQPTSALTGEGIPELFHELAVLIAKSKWMKKKSQIHSQELEPAEQPSEGCGC